MARIFITGSSDGLGKLAAEALIAKGHEVVLHARNEKRRRETLEKIRGAKDVLTADLTDLEEIKQLASDVNKSGSFDVVIHNAGVYQVSSKEMFAVNTLAPYMLTCLIERPKRLIYLSSGMHAHGHWKLGNSNSELNHVTYSDTKLHVLMLSMAAARKWQNVYSNAVDPGWVPTRMGGRGAPDNLQKGFQTQVWLAESNDDAAKVSGNYFFHQKIKHHNPLADDISLQEKFLDYCKEITGISFPEH